MGEQAVEHSFDAGYESESTVAWDGADVGNDIGRSASVSQAGLVPAAARLVAEGVSRNSGTRGKRDLALPYQQSSQRSHL